ncbi:MAG: hypothetical protein WC556_07380 [Candidatus Methanoperedens sp.]
MRGLLVRVGIDQTYGGWNAPCHADGAFCYIPMQPQNPELFDQGFKTTYDEFEQAYQHFTGAEHPFPNWLHQAPCHLDPDFRFLTYGDREQRAKRILSFFKGSLDNFIVFYASFAPMGRDQEPLVYAIMGFYRFQNVSRANQVPFDRRNLNAHTRLASYQRGDDIVIFADQNSSGRLKLLIPIGEQLANKHYYVQEKLFKAWGGISSRNGWIQRSVYLPHFCDPEKFMQWFDTQNPEFVHENNIRY